LEAVDTNVRDSVLALGQGLLSASTFSNVSLPRCRTACFVRGEMSDSEASCSDQLQLYSMHVESSILDGPLELDDTEINDTVIGVRRSTTILSYLSRFTSMAFCDGVREAHFAGGFATCVACEGPLLTGEGDLCSDGTFGADSNENACMSFVGGLRRCEEFPPRTRPN
jgi:hypothetical protein